MREREIERENSDFSKARISAVSITHERRISESLQRRVHCRTREASVFFPEPGHGDLRRISVFSPQLLTAFS